MFPQNSLKDPSFFIPLDNITRTVYYWLNCVCLVYEKQHVWEEFGFIYRNWHHMKSSAFCHSMIFFKWCWWIVNQTIVYICMAYKYIFFIWSKSTYIPYEQLSLNYSLWCLPHNAISTFWSLVDMIMNLSVYNLIVFDILSISGSGTEPKQNVVKHKNHMLISCHVLYMIW